MVRSSKPALEDRYFVERDDAIAILKKLGIKEKVILVTHSMGSNIATIFANRYPDLIKAIIYTPPNYSGKSMGEYSSRAMYESFFTTPSK
ncbi:MAG: alpha/beta hydrolase [Campylobacter sp.]|nr:alpha/beta hydrolase [Campylobacter sp.]